MSFTFGLDPEFFLIHHGELKSAIDILPKKEKSIIKNNHSYYFDNVLAEIAVNPSESKEDLICNVKSSLHGLAKVIQPAKFIIRASGNYPKKELNSFDAKIAGCNPEWDVYSLQQILPSDENVELLDGYYQFKTAFRSAGGHIHIGSNRLQDPLEVFSVIHMLDLFIGVPSILMDTDETSKDRRKIYGQAGSHRITDYGLEYRVLSNFWLSSPEHVSLIYDLTSFVLKFVEQKNHKQFWKINEDLLDEEDSSLAYSCFGYDSKMLIKTINDCKKHNANKFISFIDDYLPNELLETIKKLSNKELPDPYITWEIN
jgi:hypothetical protein